MPTYEHLCRACNQEFEDIYGMKEPIPTKCPNCNVEGKVERLISGGSGKGIVELTGQELKAHVLAEGQKLKHEANKNEKVLANLVGDDKYQRNVVDYERRKAERPKIKARR